MQNSDSWKPDSELVTVKFPVVSFVKLIDIFPGMNGRVLGITCFAIVVFKASYICSRYRSFVSWLRSQIFNQLYLSKSQLNQTLLKKELIRYHFSKLSLQSFHSRPCWYKFKRFSTHLCPMHPFSFPWMHEKCIRKS